MTVIPYILMVLIQATWASYINEIDECIGKTFHNVTLAAYYSDDNENYLNQFYDAHGKNLNALQDYLDDSCDYVTLAMDDKLGIPYGTSVCIPELNRHYSQHLQFKICDSGSNLLGMGYLRADVYVRSESDSYDKALNHEVTLVF